MKYGSVPKPKPAPTDMSHSDLASELERMASRLEDLAAVAEHAIRTKIVPGPYRTMKKAISTDRHDALVLRTAASRLRS